jgi:hypothetical protein
MKKYQTKLLSELMGKGVEIKEKTIPLKKQEEQFFFHLIDALLRIEESSNFAFDLGIDLSSYDSMYMEVIENLLYINFGDFKTTVILWWVFDRISPEGEEYGLMDENEVEHHIRTPKQLYKFLKKYE